MLNLLVALESYIISLSEAGLITYKIDEKMIYQLQNSINNLGINTPEIAEKTYSIINKINTINSKLTDVVTLGSNVIPYFNKNVNMPYLQTNAIPIINTANVDTSIAPPVAEVKEDYYLLEDFCLEWFNYELSLCEESTEHRKLSQLTVDGYHRILNTYILDYCKNNKIMYFKQLTANVINALLKTTDSYDNKRNIRIVCSLLMQFAIKNKLIKKSENPMDDVPKPVKPVKREEKEISCIEPENQHLYIKAFEKENTPMSILFITMLLTGMRPECASGLKWSCVDFKHNEIIINNAYKSFNIYDEKGKVIGHYRSDADLKTPESYRTIPMCPLLKDILLQYKESQKQRFKNYRKFKKEGRNLCNEDYCFLRTYIPALCIRYFIISTS